MRISPNQKEKGASIRLNWSVQSLWSGALVLSDNNSSRYRQLELPIRKEIFGRCRKDVVTSASHYSWCRRKVMLSTSLAVLSGSTGCTGYAETKRSTRLENREEG